MSAATDGPVVFLHSSDEHYGADQVLLDLLDALPADRRATAEFWLPTDIPHGARPLCRTLEARGAVVRHVDLPVLRRAYRTPTQLARLAWRARRLRPLLARSAPSLVYCTTSATTTAAPVARSLGLRVVGHVQEIWSRSDSVALAPLAGACHRLIAISGPVRDALPPRLRARTVVVLNATATSRPAVPLDGRDGPLRFLVASRWNGWKGHRTLLDAWDASGVADDGARLVVLGGPPPSGDAVDVPGLVEGLRHPTSVDVVGEVDDVGAHIDRADVVVVPSDRPEPFGLVAIEAFALGRPVVGSRGGGLADIVDDGVDGWLFPPGDAGSLARLLAGLTRTQVTAAGAAARSSHTKRFTVERYADQWRAATELSTPS